MPKAQERLHGLAVCADPRLREVVLSKPTRPVRILSLCSGIGGLDLGIKSVLGAACRTVLMVEREAFCVSILRARMEDGHLEHAPIWSDVKTLDAAAWRGSVDLIVGGYPCQPFSVSGKKQGHKDPRHLWPFIADIVAAVAPPLLFFENVPGHLAVGFEQVVEELSAMGYRVTAGLFSASERGAPHIRQRLFFVAHAVSVFERRQQHAEREASGQTPLHAGGHGAQGPMAHASSARCEQGKCGQGREVRQRARRSKLKRRGCHVGHADGEGQLQSQRYVAALGGRHSDASRWAVESAVGQLTDGLSRVMAHVAGGWPAEWEDGVSRTCAASANRTDGVRALGNAVDPATAAFAFATLCRQAGLPSWLSAGAAGGLSTPGALATFSLAKRQAR